MSISRIQARLDRLEHDRAATEQIITDAERIIAETQQTLTLARQNLISIFGAEQELQDMLAELESNT